MFIITHLIAFLVGLLTSHSYNATSWSGISRSLASPFVQLLSLFKNNEERNVSPQLLDRVQIVEKYGPNTWQRQAYDAFDAILTSTRNRTVFPCIYGTKAHKENSLVYLFLENEDVADRQNVRAVADAILAYVPTAQAKGLVSSMVILTPNGAEKEHTMEHYQTKFWEFIRALRQLDPKPRPADISPQTIDKNWSFCFDGEPAFIVVMTPAHHNRHSRHMTNLTMVYQPRYIFDIIMDSEGKRNSAVKTVRGLVDKYDHPLVHSPDLANFAEPDTTESRQLFLLDENVTAECPYETL